ncbi:MAG TPA: ABC transporter permease [Terriglobia bacterium]
MMRWIYTFPLRIRSLFGKTRIETELTEELRFHLEKLVEEYHARGMGLEEARYAALRELGGVEQIKEECRDMRQVNYIENFLQDVRYGLRQLWRSPSFMAVAVLALALGIGANTAIFSVVNGVLLRALPYPEPSRLMMVYEKTKEFSQSSVAYPNFLDWRRENHSFTDIAAFRGDDFNFTGSGQPEHLSGEYVSASLFPVLGVNPLLGRSFLPQEDQQGAGGVVMLSYGLWQRRFGADPKILGTSIILNTRNYTVIGILRSDFRFREQSDLYVPLGQWNPLELNDRENHPGLHAVGRLKPGVIEAAAQAEMTGIGRQLAERYPKSNGGHGITLVQMKEDMVGHIRPTLLLLLGAVGFVLIIACANVANLLLARSTARRREFAIRTALGAGRKRVVCQLLTESVLLALGAGALGLLLAYWGTRLVLAAVPDTLPRSQDIGLDPYVLLFTLAISILTGVLFGLAPGFQSSNVNPQEALKEGAQGSGGGRHRAEGAFVALEVGLAVILLSGAGLMIQSIWRLWKVNPGFNTDHLLTAQVALSPSVMASPASIRLAYQQVLARVSGVPGVRSDAITQLVPLSNDDSEIPFWLGSGPQPPQEQVSSALFYLTTSDYLHVMGIPLLEGRFFTERDTTASPNVVVIDDVMAKHIFPGQDPVGKQMNMVILGPAQIVGVVGHVRHWGLDSDDRAKVRNELYFPFLQVPDKFMSEGEVGLSLVLRTGPEPLSVLSAVRAEVAGPTEDQPIYGVQTMDQIISASLAERRFTMLLLIIFASTALVLAAVGIYGVMSYSVTRRTHELGVRMALGATRSDVLRLVVREGAVLAVIGLVTGLAAAFGLTRLLASLLYGVRPADPSTLVAVSVALGGVAFLASYIPARRATKVDPTVALRYE